MKKHLLILFLAISSCSSNKQNNSGRFINAIDIKDYEIPKIQATNDKNNACLFFDKENGIKIIIAITKYRALLQQINEQNKILEK